MQQKGDIRHTNPSLLPAPLTDYNVRWMKHTWSLTDYQSHSHKTSTAWRLVAPATSPRQQNSASPRLLHTHTNVQYQFTTHRCQFILNRMVFSCAAELWDFNGCHPTLASGVITIGQLCFMLWCCRMQLNVVVLYLS